MSKANLQVGDLVRLTGEYWRDELRGQIVRVDEVDEHGYASSFREGVGSVTSSAGHWYEGGYEAEFAGRPNDPSTPTQPADSFTIQLLVTAPDGVITQLAQKNITLEELVERLTR